MRTTLALAGLVVLLGGCATPPRIDWQKTAENMAAGACRQSSRCDAPECGRGSANPGACDNPYGRSSLPAPTPVARP